MTPGDVRKSYNAAWTALFDIVKQRNKVLQRLDMMARPAMESSTAEGFVFEFDTALARELLAEVDELTPRINAGMEEVSKYAELTGSPKVRWQSLPRNWGK